MPLKSGITAAVACDFGHASGFSDVPTVRIGGITVGALTRSQWADRVVDACLYHRTHGGRPVLTTSANGNVQSMYARSRNFRHLMDQFDAIEADGMPMVLASRLFNRTRIPERSAMTDLFHDIARRAEIAGLSIYFLGGSEDVNRATVERMNERYPRLSVAGRHNGYMSRDDEAAVIDDINRVKPDILLVGLGVPIEQEFVVRNAHRLEGVGVIKTCGGLFDFLSGKNPRAPSWMQDYALEWLFRLMNEPRRLFWRYATTNLHAIWLMSGDWRASRK